jgi:anti-sigma regulatory factor (Ser/Thr protein kinase)
MTEIGWPALRPGTDEGLVAGRTRDCSSSAGAPAHRTARDVSLQTHAAAVVGSDTELLAAALPFVDEGLREGDLVALSCPPPTVALICEALGERAGAVESDPRISLLAARAPDALTMASRYLERAMATGSGRLRVVAAVDFGSDPADWREGQRYESVVNRLMADSPLSSLCLYDERRLPTPVIASAGATHPQLVHGPDWRVSAEFQDPGTYVPSLPVPREPFEDGEPIFVVESAPTLAGLRHQLGAVIASRVPDRDQQEDLHLAASEIAANAFRHGVRPVSARVWAEGNRLVCVIADRGTSYSDPFSGFRPAHGLDLANGGMGLWLARKLWDHVDVLPTEQGLTVRLSTRLN